MNRIFTASEGFVVPDGTIVHSVLDAAALGREAGEWAEAMSLAVGCIPPHTASKIHLHPVVTQATWVISGRLTVTMKDSASDAPYALDLVAEQAALALPGTFFQLINRSDVECRVLYIVVPAFVYEVGAGGEVLYNDALVFDLSWDELAAAGWAPAQLHDVEVIRAARRVAQDRLRSRGKDTSLGSEAAED